MKKLVNVIFAVVSLWISVPLTVLIGYEIPGDRYLGVSDIMWNYFGDLGETLFNYAMLVLLAVVIYKTLTTIKDIVYGMFKKVRKN